MEHSNPTFAKIPIHDTRKFEQWEFRIQQYLQNEHYALWEVIEFGDSYKAPPEETGKGPKRRNDVKARTTLLLALADEHQLKFSKYETAKELWEAILKNFGRNEATKKTKKDQLKLQYCNFKAEGSETLEQTFNRLQAIMSHLEFMDVEIKQDDLNQKFLTSLAPEWLIGKGKVHTASVLTSSTQVSTASTDVAAASLSHDIISDDEVSTKFALMAKSNSNSDNERNRDDLETMSLDDVYNHLKVYEPEVQKKLGLNSQNMAFISSSNTSSGKADDEVPTEFALMAKSSSSSDNEGNPQNNIDDKEYWDSGCSRHMTGNHILCTNVVSQYVLGWGIGTSRIGVFIEYSCVKSHSWAIHTFGPQKLPSCLPKRS
nr:hypothetical protein [Tanacetum cinerariifolium]